MPGAPRVLIVESGGHASRLLRPLFGPKIAEAARPVEYALAVEAVTALRPNLVLLDLEGSPELALATVEALMGQCPVPVLLFAGPADRQAAIGAMAAGALEVVERPARATPEFFQRLAAQVLLLSKVGVVRHVKGRKRPAKTERAPFPLVAIASSLGGPKALAVVLSELPARFGGAVAICQHITVGFADDLARWLKAETKRDVVEASAATALQPNRIFIAGSDVHLVAKPDFSLGVEATEPVGGFRPSGDVLLRSAAACFRERAIGVVLTGMGRDGARGLKEIRARGGHTIAQDEASSVVFGMPREAIALGAAEKVLPLNQIAAQLARWAHSHG